MPTVCHARYSRPWLEGTLLGLNGCQDTVTLALAQGLRGPRNPHTLRRRQRELAQEPLVLAVDPRPQGPRKQDDLVALVISGVYRQHAHPEGLRVAWHIVGAQEKEPWIDHFCRLLRQLASTVPATVPVPGLCDQGLGSRDLWAQIVDSGTLWVGIPACATSPPSPFNPRVRPHAYQCAR